MGKINAFLTAAANSAVLSFPSHLMAYNPVRDRVRSALWKALLPVCLIQTAQSFLYGYTILRDGNGHLTAYAFASVYMTPYFLENALEACRAVSAPFIRVRRMWEDGHVVLTVDNSCEQAPQWENGRLLSSKREGYSIGTWLVQRTAERRGGFADFSCKDGVFFASVCL